VTQRLESDLRVDARLEQRRPESVSQIMQPHTVPSQPMKRSRELTRIHRTTVSAVGEDVAVVPGSTEK
jgi:hypothetical protein